MFVLILTYVWNEDLILWATEKFKNSTFGGFYGERTFARRLPKLEPNDIFNVIIHFRRIYEDNRSFLNDANLKINFRYSIWLSISYEIS